jgi:hypothetical protein
VFVQRAAHDERILVCDDARRADLMPGPGSWITTALYLWGAYSCRATAIGLDGGSHEPRAWTAIAILLTLLGVSELLHLQPTLTNLGRAAAFQEGWYWHRHGIQAAVTKIGVAMTVILSLGILFSARLTSVECAIALACAVMLLGYILVRVVSLHQVDTLLLKTTFGLRWGRIPEFAGCAIILLSSLSRRF